MCMGETSRFAVVVDGKPDPDILWYKVSFALLIAMPNEISLKQFLFCP